MKGDSMIERIIPAKVEMLDEVIEFVNEHVADKIKDATERAMLDIAVEEIFVNIANYAYQTNKEEAMARIIMDTKSDCVLLQFEDNGTPFNPLEREDPDTELGEEERGIGGLGIFIVKECMDEVFYEYKDGKNILTIVKYYNSDRGVTC